MDHDAYTIPETSLRAGHICDKKTSALLQRTLIANSNGQGVMVRNHATATVEDCEIENPGAWGVSVSDPGTRAMIKGTSIMQAFRGGVDVGRGGYAEVMRTHRHSISTFVP